MTCAHCRLSLIGKTRYRLHFEPFVVRSRDPGDKFFCSIPCLRAWATRIAEEAE